MTKWNCTDLRRKRSDRSVTSDNTKMPVACSGGSLGGVRAFAQRSREIAKVRFAHVGEGSLCDWLLLPCRSTWYRTRPHAGLRCAFTRRSGIRYEGIRESE